MSPRAPADLAARRADILRLARELAERDGWSAVTIRGLASALGMSQPVIYGVFSGREDIVDAVAVDGFTELATTLRRSRGTRGLVRAYLEFAAAHPATYEAMFALPLGVRFADEGTPAALRECFELLHERVGRGDEGRSEAAWSLLHGVASLEASGRLAPDAATSRAARVVRMLQA